MVLKQICTSESGPAVISSHSLTSPDTMAAAFTLSGGGGWLRDSSGATVITGSAAYCRHCHIPSSDTPVLVTD